MANLNLDCDQYLAGDLSPPRRNSKMNVTLRESPRPTEQKPVKEHVADDYYKIELAHSNVGRQKARSKFLTLMSPDFDRNQAKMKMAT